VQDALLDASWIHAAIPAYLNELERFSRKLDNLANRMYDEAVASRMRPFSDGVHGFPRMVRDLAKSLGKKVVFEIEGDATLVDRDILEKLEARDFEFRTDNDSELLAVYVAEKLSLGSTLDGALKDAIEDLDGTFSFLVSTGSQLGDAKDNLAAKPMVLFETDELIAIASEEVSINRIFPGQALNTTEPLPGSYKTWSRASI